MLAVSSKNPEDTEVNGVSDDVFQKSEHMKTLTTDLTSANYNMAILGAVALILHELGTETGVSVDGDSDKQQIEAAETEESADSSEKSVLAVLDNN